MRRGVRTSIRRYREAFYEIWSFFRARRNWWLMPLLAILLIMGLFMILTEASALSPLIYTLF